MVFIKNYMTEIQGYLDSGDTQNLKYCLRKLLQALQSDPKVDNFTWRGNDNKTGLTVLEVACLYGDGELVEALLKKKTGINGLVVFPDVNSKNKDGDTPLHFLCKEKNGVSSGQLLKIANLLLDNGANKDAQNNKGETPLYASRVLGMGMPPVAALLIEKGAGLHLKTKKDKNLLKTKKGNAALLHFFLLANDPNIDYQKLCGALKKQGVDLKLKDVESGVTALHLVAAQGKLELLNFFLDEGLKITKDKDGNTPLHYAAHSGTLDVVKALLEEDVEQINLQNKQKETPLHIASMANKRNIVRYLLNNGADRELKNEDNKTAWGLANELNHQNIERVFFDVRPHAKPVKKPGFIQRLFERIELISLRFANLWTFLKNTMTRWRLQKAMKAPVQVGQAYQPPPNQPTMIVEKKGAVTNTSPPDPQTSNEPRNKRT